MTSSRALEAIAPHPGQQQDAHLRQRPGEADQRERAGLVGDVVDQPRDRDQIDAVADQRNRLPDPEQPEVAVSQRPEHRSGY